MKKDDDLRLLRMIAWNTGHAVGGYKEGTTIFDLYPLPLDKEIKSKIKDREKEKKRKAKEVFEKREQLKRKKNGEK